MGLRGGGAGRGGRTDQTVLLNSVPAREDQFGRCHQGTGRWGGWFTGPLPFPRWVLKGETDYLEKILPRPITRP